MEQLLICVILAAVGLCFGSFAGATVWRLRARQLVQDKSVGEKVDAKEYKALLPLTHSTITSDRSRCLHCGHALAWYDLLPLASWVSTKGKCRYCHASIGWFEPLIELGVAAFFVVSYLLWPFAFSSQLSVIEFLLWLVAGVMLAVLFVYDLKWSLLPNYVIFPLIVVSFFVALIHLTYVTPLLGGIESQLIAIAILSGLYFFLWSISKGRWIGLGDVKLGLALALLLGEWQLAFIALFAANLIGCLLVIPGLLSGKMTRQTHLPFGPLLITGCVIAMLFGERILNFYFVSFI